MEVHLVAYKYMSQYLRKMVMTRKVWKQILVVNEEARDQGQHSQN